YYFFCLYLSAHYLFLYSFPTRRSSDLSLLGIFLFMIPLPSKESGITIPVAAMANFLQELLGSSIPAIMLVIIMIALLGTILAKTDRKSTRLNSSHVKISYAVFCLKKKN